MSYQLTTAKIWDGAAWVNAVGGLDTPAVVSATTGSPTETTITDGGDTFDIYSFTGDGSITISEAGFAELLVVGGGGGTGGGGSWNAGGGAGGYLPITSQYLPVGTATVTVGAGGAAGANGGGSRLSTSIANGGGRGGDSAANSGGAGQVGGSGGGGSANSLAGGVGTIGLGNSGANGGSSSTGGWWRFRRGRLRHNRWGRNSQHHNWNFRYASSWRKRYGWANCRRR